MFDDGRSATYYGADPERTPRLVLDPLVIERQVGRFRTALPSAEIFFPVKCCPMPAALLTLDAAGCRFEYASLAEIERIDRLDLAVAPGIFGAPARPVEDSRRALDQGVKTFVIDSIDEARKIATIGSGIRVLIRLEVESADTTMPLSTKFGVTTTGNRELLWACADLGLHVDGYVFHVGSQTRSTVPWARAIEAVAYAREAADAVGVVIEVVDIGGGFPVSYRGAPVASIEQIGDQVASSLSDTGLSDLRLIAEPGRYLVAEAAQVHASVLATMTDGDHARAVLDVGVFNGLYEVLEGITYDYCLTAREGVHERARLWQLAGPSCDGNDIVGTERALPESLSDGDVLIVKDAGAYADSYASDFCGLDAPTSAIVSSHRETISPNGVTRVNSNGELFGLAQDLELNVFRESGLLDADGTLDSYARYDEHSVFNVLHRDGEAIGVLREIWPSDIGLKTINDLNVWPTTGYYADEIGHDRIGDIGTLAIRRQYTGGIEALKLYASAYWAARAHGISHWVAAIDDAVLSYMRASLGFNFVDLGPSVVYIGSPSTPVIGKLDTFRPHIQAAAPEAWERIVGAPQTLHGADFLGPASWGRALPEEVGTSIDLRDESNEEPAGAAVPSQNQESTGDRSGAY